MSISKSLPRALFTSRRQPPHLPRAFLHGSPRRRQPEDNPPEKPASSFSLGPWQGKKGAKREDAENLFPKFTEEEYEELQKKYTPEQIQAIRAGEDAIDSQDVLDRGIVRRDRSSIDYVDDFASIRAVIDRQPKAPDANHDPKLRFKSDGEIAEDVARWAFDTAQEGEEIDDTRFMEYADDLRLTVGKEEAERNPPLDEAPALRKMTDPLVRTQARAWKEEVNDEMTPLYQRLSKMTGISVKEMKGLRAKTMITKYVTNQTRMGKITSVYFLTIVGNRRGLLGIGEGKGREADGARRQSILDGIRNMTPILRYEDRTIYGDVKGKVGATELELYTRPPGRSFLELYFKYHVTDRSIGFGLRCQDKIYEMCKCAGIHDMAAKVTRARNPMNTIKAAFQALTKQRDPEQLARGRGIKLVDLRRVYYAGNV